MRQNIICNIVGEQELKPYPPHPSCFKMGHVITSLFLCVGEKGKTGQHAANSKYPLKSPIQEQAGFAQHRDMLAMCQELTATSDLCKTGQLMDTKWIKPLHHNAETLSLHGVYLCIKDKRYHSLIC